MLLWASPSSPLRCDSLCAGSRSSELMSRLLISTKRLPDAFLDSSFADCPPSHPHPPHEQSMNTARMVLEGSNQRKKRKKNVQFLCFPNQGKLDILTLSFKIQQYWSFFCLFVCFPFYIYCKLKIKTHILHFYRHIHTTKIDYVETRYTRHKVYTVHVHGGMLQETRTERNNSNTHLRTKSKTLIC